MNAAPARTAAILPRRRPWAGFLLGVGMGGFFDGLLLHQIFQWHHLLSGLGGSAGAAALSDLRVQVVADGVFHALMYAVADRVADRVAAWRVVRVTASASVRASRPPGFPWCWPLPSPRRPC
jgi:uncharacterized membrane protein